MCVYKTVKELKISLVLYRIPHFYLHCVCFIVHCEIRSEVLIVGANFYLTASGKSRLLCIGLHIED